MDQIEQWATSMADGTFDLSILDPDVSIWHSYDGLDMDIEEERRLIESTRETVTNLLADKMAMRRHHRGALLDYVLRITYRDGSIVTIPAFALVRTEGGRITRIEEYTDVDLSDSGATN